jgi:CRP-like cAMP-binding protein
MVGAGSTTDLGIEQLVDRLAAHRLLAAAPREQLAWVAEHGQLLEFPAGHTLFRTGEPIVELYVVLAGRFSIRVHRGSGWRKVMEWRAGDVSGLLPYSRMTATPGDTRTDEPTEVVSVHRDQFPELTRNCHELTAILVHVMVDRARHFRSNDLHDEKLASLGRLAAGLAHELNNPASAAARSAEVLLERMPSVEAAFRALGGVRLSQAELTAFSELRSQCLAGGPPPLLSHLEQAEREEALGAWLARHGIDQAAAESLAETGLTISALDTLAGALGSEALGVVLVALASSCSTRRLTSDIERRPIRPRAGRRGQRVHLHGSGDFAEAGGRRQGVERHPDDSQVKGQVEVGAPPRRRPARPPYRERLWRRAQPGLGEPDRQRDRRGR